MVDVIRGMALTRTIAALVLNGDRALSLLPGSPCQQFADNVNGLNPIDSSQGRFQVDFRGTNLILIAGMPRSGTTWVAKVFDSHPDVVYRHEPEHVYRIEGLPASVESNEYENFAEAVRTYGQQLLSMSDPRVLAKRPLLPKRYLGRVRYRLHSASLLLSSLASRISLKVPTYNPVKHLSMKEVRVVWKFVSRIGRLGVFARALPEARIIFIQRHPCGYVASQIRGKARGMFGSAGKGSAISQEVRRYIMETYGVTDSEVGKMTAEEKLAWRWVAFNEMAMQQVETLSNCETVWYDDLCREPVIGFRQLFGFAGLDWNESTEEFLQSTISKHDGRYYSIFKDPLRASESWKDELDPEVIDRVVMIARRSPVFSRWCQ